MKSFALSLSLALAAACGPALAHVSASPSEARAGAYQAVRFQVGHGCDGAATTALRIDIPDGVDTARPQPKPGWTLSMTREGERVTAVTWRGRLPADQFDDFGLLVKTPAAAGVLYFPAVQTCGAASEQWNELPEAAETSPLAHPAPKLIVTVGAGADAHHAH